LNLVYAVDVSSGQVLWRHEHVLPEELSALVRIVPANRGVALYKDNIYYGTLDAQLVALKAATGEVVWKKQVADPVDGYYFSAAPLAVKGKIIIGSSGSGETGPRGFVAAFHADTGEEIWRTYSIPAAGEPGSETWAGESWKYGGGAIWLTGTYDAKLNLLFFGVGNPAPWSAHLRQGANLYTDSSIALDADTGRIKWHFQYVPNDTWDMDTAQAHLLIDLGQNGHQLPVTFQANKTGFHFSLDRHTGKFITANRFARFINIWQGVDPETGKLIENPGMRPAAGAKPMDICPTAWGATGWAHAAYHPTTGLVYLPSQELCMKYSLAADVQYRRGALYMGAELTTYPAQDQVGAVRAIDPNTGESRWEWWTRGPLQAGGVLATSGGLIFVGTQDGKLVALDAASGGQLWEFSLGAPVTAPPVTYSFGGKQHVVVVTGGSQVQLDFMVGKDPRFQYLRNIPLGGTVVVFGLD
jgi:alcohol dehydrogenase (cytochrome c)